MNPESEVIAKAADKAIQNPTLEKKIVDAGTGNERVLVSDPKAVAALSQVGYLSWSRACLVKLAEAEKSLLSRCKSFITSKFVNVRLANSSIYTITARTNAEAGISPIPFVLIHGFAAGVAIWAGNLDALASKRTVHAFDILGFGRSSRPTFSTDATLAELEFVQSIEDWRKEMKIEKMILVGHSFGGYLASSYTLEHPDRVRHLILVDPWGFPVKPAIEQVHIPVWMRFVGTMLSKFNPLATLRFVGPFGPSLIKSLRSDLGIRYALENPEAIYEYIFQCNVQKPTGEVAFSTMTKSFGWAKRPMINRFNGIDPTIPVSFILGSKSWIDSGPAYEIQARRPESYVDVQLLSGAGHHVYADVSESFNALCNSISDIVDADEDLRPISESNTSLNNNASDTNCCEHDH